MCDRFQKKVFLKRISTVYPAGSAQGKIFEHFKFKGKYRYTGGYGNLNYILQPAYRPRAFVRRFLYVGRLVEVKNLKMLIKVFNSLPHLQLDIIGFGEQAAELKRMSQSYIHFLGAIPNKELSTYYQHSDVFVLPSVVEPWGLVVEESLNNGTPVIVSDRVGCKDDLVTEEVGLVFSAYDKESLKDAINIITEVDHYNKLRENI